MSGSESNNSSPQQRNSALYVRVLSGSIGSIITSLVVTPLEVVKVRLQASATESALPPNVLKCPKGCGTFILTNFAGQTQLLPKNVVPFFDCRTGHLTELARQSCTGSNGILKTLRKIYRTEGLRGIYAGLSPTLVMAVPNTVIYFTTYEELSYRMRSTFAYETETISSSWIPLVAGGSARFFASSATAPFEYMRTRQALLVGTNQSSQGLWSDMKVVIRNDGTGALYKGFRPTLWRDIPFSAIYWVSLEHMREVWKRQEHNRPSPTVQAAQAFVNGLVSGVIAAACTTPFDVIKTRQQQFVNENVSHEFVGTGRVVCKHDGAVAIDAAMSSTRSTIAELRHIAQTEGVTSLWSGNVARMLKVAPACAIMLSSYELGKRWLE